MKRAPAIMVTVLAIGIFFSGMAFGVEPPAGPPQAQGSFMSPPPTNRGPQEPPLPLGMKLLSDYQQINVLSELTGLPQGNIRQMLVCAPIPAILEEYGVSPETFRTAMDKQSVKLISQAETAGIITKKQAEDILKRMNQKACPALCREEKGERAPSSKE